MKVSYKEKRSAYAPEAGMRYDGVYRIEKCWLKVGVQGSFKVYCYLFVRCDNKPAPWTSDEHGDRSRPLPKLEGNRHKRNFVIGSAILIFGLYTVIWGKEKEDSTRTVAGSEKSPLLVNTYLIRCD
ncbi:LOW QUALITY PROTEIN: hypothetical protein HID58_087256 [Brassica napus]|uniref:RING-type E3 ubiquitin transferase n=1 Tax=Brassica napus TaxID=3708 RepID=A0ABQ7XSR0_BRANA|nr:LOW QUALITY PROTEIN: hypothetical protein HID58_087256 [Brassica napus]